MINVYINTEVIDAVLSGLKGIDRSNNEELSIEIIDNMPLTGQITLEGDNRIIKTFARDEMRTNTQLITSGVFDFVITLFVAT